MHVSLMLAVAIAGAASPSELPIHGVWRALPSPGVQGPDRLTLSEKIIKFGQDGEPVASWTSKDGITHIATRSGLTYTFKQKAPNRICLEGGLRTAAPPSATATFPLRCFEKIGDPIKG